MGVMGRLGEGIGKEEGGELWLVCQINKKFKVKKRGKMDNVPAWGGISW